MTGKHRWEMPDQTQFEFKLPRRWADLTQSEVAATVLLWLCIATVALTVFSFAYLVVLTVFGHNPFLDPILEECTKNG